MKRFVGLGIGLLIGVGVYYLLKVEKKTEISYTTSGPLTEETLAKALASLSLDSDFMNDVCRQFREKLASDPAFAAKAVRSGVTLEFEQPDGTKLTVFIRGRGTRS